MSLAFAIVRLAAALALLTLAWDWRSPAYVGVRTWVFAGLLLGSCGLAAVELGLWRGLRTQGPAARVAGALAFTVASLALLTTAALEAQFGWMRYEVLHADPQTIEKLGRHLMIGYRDLSELRDLVERRAIAGVFIAPRNVQGRTAAEIRQDVDALQDIRRRQGLPPLWIAADHEGGIGSRLTPPLVPQRRLATPGTDHADPAERRAAVAQYAATQGQGLASLGINLNFAPVVDLDFQAADPNDRYTRISERAISRDPQVVSDVAEQYCATLQQS